MKQWSQRAVLLSVCVTTACGNSRPSQAPDGTDFVDSSEFKQRRPDGGATTGTPEEETSKSRAECTSFDMDLESTLMKGACEVAKQEPAFDPKGKLEISLSPSTPKVSAGGHVDLVVTLQNKTKEELPLQFTVDPLPRFEVETYDAKGKRVDMPTTQPPPLPAGVPPRGPGEAKTARVVIAANGSARIRTAWEAVKMRWAPEKVRGTPPEKGYPRLPAGPLPKGKYTIKVVLPLIGVVEGFDHEVSAPKTEIEVTK